MGGHTLMRTRLKGLPGYGRCVEFRRQSESRADRQTERWRDLESPRCTAWFLFQLSVFCHLREYISHDQMFTSSHVSSWLPLLSSSVFSYQLIFALISWPLLFRYFSLLNSSHLIFILTTTFFLSLPLCFQVSRGKKERRGGQGWGLLSLFLYQTHISCFYFIFIIFSSLVFVFSKEHPEGKPWVKLTLYKKDSQLYLISKTFSSNHS